MKNNVSTIEELKKEDVTLVEVELMLSVNELQIYAKFCKKHDIKFNDWIRNLATDAIKKEEDQ